MFPSVKRNYEQRKLWIKALRRENVDKSQWEPKKSDRICSIHFADEIPTPSNPLPTLYLGYESQVIKTRRILFMHPIPPKKQKREQSTWCGESSSSSSSSSSNTTKDSKH